MMDILEIMKRLPHRYPMLLVDRILEVEENHIVGLKNVSANEPFFQGHFPGAPIMPGVLILEALAQCGGVLFGQTIDLSKNLFLFAGIDKARFRKPVVPGDQLILDVTTLQKRSNSARLRGIAKVNDTVVAEAEFMTMLAPRPE